MPRHPPGLSLALTIGQGKDFFMRHLLNSKYILIAALLCRISWATLGQEETSVENERRLLYSGTHSIPTTSGLYTIHEIRNSGIQLKEYSVAGTIVGISWRGMNPDLSQILGTYFSEFEAAPKITSRKFGRRSFSSVEGDTLVLEGQAITGPAGALPAQNRFFPREAAAMISNNKTHPHLFAGLVAVFLCNGCFFGGSTTTQSSNTPTANNVMTVTVNGSQCGSVNYQYPNSPAPP